MLADMRDKVVVITGANTGVGYAAAEQLGAKGARLLLACRSAAKAAHAAQRLRHAVTDVDVTAVTMDLADRDSISRGVAHIARITDRVDVLLNNAGVFLPAEQQLVHGAEVHYGVNFLGHFSLTWQLAKLLREAHAPRIVHVSSVTARWSKWRVEHIHARPHAGMAGYALSKLANLVYALEIARRWPDVVSVASHPGYVATQLQRNLWLSKVGNPLLGSSPVTGAVPLVHAASAAEVVSGSYWGPKRWPNLRAEIARIEPYRSAKGAALGRAVWQHAEQALELPHS